jgi:hypothetical protein
MFWIILENFLSICLMFGNGFLRNLKHFLSRSIEQAGSSMERVAIKDFTGCILSSQNKPRERTMEAHALRSSKNFFLILRASWRRQPTTLPRRAAVIVPRTSGTGAGIGGHDASIASKLEEPES